MISKRQLNEESLGLMSLRSLVEVYEELAASRMQRIRGAVLQSRQFLEGLLSVFVQAKSAYEKQTDSSKTLLTRNGRTVAVFVSSNTGLYGDIVNKVFDKFREFVSKNKPDVVVLGKTGVNMVRESMPGVVYNYYDFSDEKVETDSFEMIMRYLIQFEKIVVFYGQFKSLSSQVAVGSPVSGDIDQITKIEESLNESKFDTNRRPYLFEPSVSEIVKVFEGEVLASIFEQTLYESHLSKFASRLLALDKAMDNIDRDMKKIKVMTRRVEHNLDNRRQRNILSGMSVWGGQI